MEIAVADVAEDGGEDAEVVHFALGDFDDVGEAGEGDGYVCGPDFLAFFFEGEHAP